MKSKRRTTAIRLLRLGLFVWALQLACIPDYRQEAIRSLTPESTFDEDRRRPGRVYRMLPIRVWADQEVRKVGRWKHRIEAYVGRANNGLAEFGIQLRIAAIEPWRREADPADTRAMLDELHRLDAGEGVEWVMGVVAASGGYRIDHRIGGSVLFSKHFVMREAAEFQEYDALRNSDLALSEEDLDTLYRKRMAHRSTVILLHEWAHTLGAMHTRSSDWIMSPTYFTSALQFSEPNRRIVELMLEHRLEGSADLTCFKAHREQLAALDTAALHPDEVEQQRAWLDQIIASLSTPPAEAPVEPRPVAADQLTRAEAESLEQALRLVQAGRTDQAMASVEAVLAAHPDVPRVALIACAIQREVDASDPRTGLLCERAARLNPHVAPAHYALAAHYHTVGEHRKALVAVVRAAESVDADTPGRYVVMLAALLVDLDLPILAGRLAERFPEDPEAQAACKRARQAIMRSGLHPAEAVPAPQRPDYIRRMRRAYQAFTRDRPSRAAALARALRRDYPEVAGPLTVLCEAHRIQNKLGLARRECRRAIEIHPEASLAHFSLGLISMMQRRTVSAEVQFMRTIELDPDFNSVYAMLAMLYKQTRKPKKLADIRRRFRKRFSKAPRF